MTADSAVGTASRRISRRDFLGQAARLGAAAVATGVPGMLPAAPPATPPPSPPLQILLRSSWQTVNIGDIAHTPGMLRLIERHLPQATVTLWPSGLSAPVEKMLRSRFPRLAIAHTGKDHDRALAECGFCLHGSGPMLLGADTLKRWRSTGKPYGIGGVTLHDGELKEHRELLAGARFVFCRDTKSLEALRALGPAGPLTAFGPDATFALDLRDDTRADSFLAAHRLQAGRFACFVPRLRFTPYWKSGATMSPDEIARKESENARHAEPDHARIRHAIVEWVRTTGHRALLCPEMTYAVELLRPLLFDPLPDDVKPHVVVRPDYWLTDEAASTYARAAAIVSLEMHSPIIAIAAGTPAIHVRQPTDSRKGQMWKDVGLGDWLFEVEDTTGERIADALLALHRDAAGTREQVRKAQAFVAERGRTMMDAITA